MASSSSFQDSSPASQFPGTRWSVVLLAQGKDGKEAEAALEQICQRYWYPIYAFLRKRGRNATEAEDLTQGFFHRLLADGTLERAQENRGKLRSFLLADLKRYLIDESRKENALKRGGGALTLDIDQAAAEARYQDWFVDSGADPEALFEKAWASDLLASVMNTLSEAYAKSGKGELFEALRDSISGGDTGATYSDVANRLNTTEGALRLQVMRMRRSFKDQLQREIAETVETPDDVAEELRYLVGLLRG